MAMLALRVAMIVLDECAKIRVSKYANVLPGLQNDVYSYEIPFNPPCAFDPCGYGFYVLEMEETDLICDAHVNATHATYVLAKSYEGIDKNIYLIHDPKYSIFLKKIIFFRV